MNFQLRSKMSRTILLLVVFVLGSAPFYANSPTIAAAAKTACPKPTQNSGDLITEYTTPTANSNPTGIAAGPDGALWYGTAKGKHIGRITTDGQFTEYPFPLAHDGDQRFFAPGSDGAMWFTDDWQNKIGRITSDGKITQYAIPTQVADTDGNGTAYMTSLPRGLVIGADKALWFTEAYGNKIGRITTDGDITEYLIPTANSTPVGIALGSDGAVWFVEKSANQIGRITTDGEITEYPIPTANSTPLRITAGSDGALWFTEIGGNNIGRITPDGKFTEYALPAGAGPVGITALDNAIWFTEYNANKIGCITMDGSITEYAIPTSGSVPFGIVAGADGALWFTESGRSRIGRLQVQAASVSTTALTTFSPKKFNLPVTFSYGSEWNVAEEYRDVVSLAADGFDGFFSFINPQSIRIAGPKKPFAAIPFPADFVNWIQAHDLIQVVKTQPVVVSGFHGTEIDADATSVCGKKTKWLFLERTGWNCAFGVHYRFIYLDDVNGSPLLIMLEGFSSPEAFMLKVDASQAVLATASFGK
jgi:virginiamycin B lyase